MSSPPPPAAANAEPFDPSQARRPDPRLMRYYVLVSLLSGPFFPLVLLPLYFKYETLEYRFDQEGVGMRWGILFRREVYLTYRRIQDIHLTRNLVQRWLGLATVSVQTASGSALPEMAIEGIPQAEALRDFFYSKMRGAQQATSASAPDTGPTATEAPAATASSSQQEAQQLLREIRDYLRVAADRQGARS